MNYKTLCELNFNHTFFKDNICNNISVIPDTGTKSILNKSDCLIRSDYGKFRILFNEKEVEKLKAIFVEDDEFRYLWFKLKSTDPYFKNYTDIKLNDNENILLIQTADFAEKKIGLNISDAEVLGAENKLIRDVLTRQEHMVRPMAVLRMDMKELVNNVFEDKRKRTIDINFNTRSTFWCYNIVLRQNKINQVVKVNDLKGSFEFENVGQHKLIDGREAVKFVSREPVELMEYSDKHFQLIVNGMTDERVVEKRLPVADISRVRPEIIDNEEKIYSDIFYYN